MGVEELGTEAEGTKAPAKKESFFHRLYVGTGAFDVIGARKRWYLFFGALVLVCIASMVFRGFNLGIEFKGGTQIQLPARFSTEFQGADWLEPPAVGARFVGRSAHKAFGEWQTTCTIVHSAPPS